MTLRNEKSICKKGDGYSLFVITHHLQSLKSHMHKDIYGYNWMLSSYDNH